MDFLFGQQIAKLNWIMGISLAEKFRGSTDTKAPATFCYKTFLRDQLPEVLTEELISSASLLIIVISQHGKNTVLCVEKSHKQLVFNLYIKIKHPQYRSKIHGSQEF